MNLNDLKKLHEKGLALIYLRPKSKKPIDKRWTARKKNTWEELENSFEKNYNVGVRLGSPSKLSSGKYLGAIDCDVKSKSRKALLEMKEELRKLGIPLETAPIVMSGRGNGSRHVYVQTTEPMVPMKYASSKNLVKVLMLGETHPHSQREMEGLTQAEKDSGYRIRPAWEISFMGEGQQTVLPPSIHPDSDRAYAWASPLTVKFLPTFDPKLFVSQVKRAKAPRLKDFEPEDVDLDALGLSREMLALIRTGEGCNNKSDDLFSVCLALCRQGATDGQILSCLTDRGNWLGETAYEHRETQDRASAADWLNRYTLTKARFETDIARRFENKPELKRLTFEEVEEQEAESVGEEDWRDKLQKEGRKFKPSLANIELILSHLTSKQVFIHDLFSTRDSYGVDSPWGGQKGEHLSDIDLIKIRRWLSSTGFAIEPSSNLALDAVKFIADRNKTHPVREWLSSLEWDGTPRINTWIKDYLHGEARDPYLSQVSRLFLLAMVKRVFEPGCQWDYVLVLEGEQGTYKSTTARILAGDKWFMDNLPELKDKDAMLNLHGKWLVELGELSDVKRADYNAVKAFLNRRIDTVRSPYGLLKMDIPRQNVFIGTVNEGEYLRDPTGNRRFWPVRVGVCDVEGLRRDRDQLFAEAMWVYENCFDGRLSMTDEALKQAVQYQNERRISDDSSDMAGKLLEFIEAQEAKPKNQRFDFSKFKMMDLFGSFGPWSEWPAKGYLRNVGAQVLSQQGFEKKNIYGGYQYWGYKSPKFGGS